MPPRGRRRRAERRSGRVAADERPSESDAAARVRRMLEEIVDAVGVDAAIEVAEDAVGVHANLDGEDLGC